jgi:hypothetical protein
MKMRTPYRNGIRFSERRTLMFLMAFFQKEEIARQFQLPERKSKIATLLKQDEDENKQYCICRSSDSSRFMM